MKKEDITSLIVYAVMIIIAVVLGFTVLRDLVSQLDPNNVPFKNTFIFAALVVILGIVLNAIFIELGHLIGAKIGGYSVISFNVLWFCFYKKQGKWRFGFKSFDGLTGETKIRPNKEKTSPKPYVWGPIAFYFVELVIVAIISILLTGKTSTDTYDLGWLLVSAFIFAAVGGLVILYDYVPFKLDAMNDGYRLMLTQRPINKKAYDIMLNLQAEQFDGNSVSLPEPFEEITDYTAQINLMIVYDYLSKGEAEKANKLIDLMLDNKKQVNEDTLLSLEGLKLYLTCKVLSPEELEKHYSSLDETYRKHISACKSAEAALAYLYIATYIEKSRFEIVYATQKFNKSLKRLSETRKEIISKLFDESVEEIKAKHPDYFKEEE